MKKALVTLQRAAWALLVAALGVQDRAHAITYDVVLDAAQAVPAPTLGGATPSGTATVDVNTITGATIISGSYAGMSSAVINSHLHGLAPPGTPAGVIFGLSNTGGTSGTFTGSSTLSDVNLNGLLDGVTYINVHTDDNPSGEIRGQVVDSDIKVFRLDLNADPVIPIPDLSGGFTPVGEATVVYDISSRDVEISGSYSGMTTDVTVGHLHGPAAPGDTASPIFALDVVESTSGTFSGAATLSPSDFDALLAGLTYINIHTGRNGPGEIRAQVPAIPEPSTLALCVASAVALFGLRRIY